MNLVLDEVKEALTGMCPSAVFTRIHLILCRRGRQHPLSQARPHCRTRHPPSRHLARGRKRRDPEPLHTGRGMIQRLARGTQPFLEAYGAKTTGRTAARIGGVAWERDLIRYPRGISKTQTRHKISIERNTASEGLRALDTITDSNMKHLRELGCYLNSPSLLCFVLWYEHNTHRMTL